MKDITNTKMIEFYIKRFEKILNSLEVDTTCFNKNIKTLKVIKTKDLSKNSYADYYIEDNIIKINNKIKDSIYHEMLHMASNYYDEEEQIFYTGFSSFDTILHETYGNGFNEGMTCIIDKSYFSKNNTDSNTSHFLLTELLTNLFSVKSLMKSYFERDLETVKYNIEILSDMETANTLIESLDKIYMIETFDEDASKELKNAYTEYFRSYIYLLLNILHMNYYTKTIPVEEFESGLKASNRFILSCHMNGDDTSLFTQDDFEVIKEKANMKILTKLG